MLALFFLMISENVSSNPDKIRISFGYPDFPSVGGTRRINHIEKQQACTTFSSQIFLVFQIISNCKFTEKNSGKIHIYMFFFHRDLKLRAELFQNAHIFLHFFLLFFRDQKSFSQNSLFGSKNRKIEKKTLISI